ncbi:MAG: hypothetical protein WC205_07455 [Opitutaceae bacterium]|jgi:hypothetical protein
MTTFSLRRQRSIITLVVIILALLAGHLALQVAFYPLAICSGFLLFALIILLTLFNARKKLPFLPLLKASHWLQFHAYAGWLSVVVFLLHIDWRIPHGTLEQILAAVFVVVAGSGIFGMILSRMLPPRITRSGDPIIFERIPGLRRRLLEHTDALVLKAEETTGSTSLADFYGKHLRRYLDHQPAWFLAMRNLDRRNSSISTELKSIQRYLNADELAVSAELADIIEAKRDLDFQYSAQRLLKTWLFIHIPLTYSLLILGVVHACIALSYSSSAW